MTAEWLEHELQCALQAFQADLLAVVQRAAINALLSTSSGPTAGREATAGASSNGFHTTARARALSAALRARIVAVVHERPGISTREIARAIGIHVATVRRYLRALVDDRFLWTERGPGEAPGRPAGMYFVRGASDADATCAVDVAGTVDTAGTVDIAGTVDAAAELGAAAAGHAGQAREVGAVLT